MKQGELKQTTLNLKDFIKLYEKGNIKPYDKNRGNGKIRTALVKRIAKDFDFQSLGLLSMEQTDKEKYLLRDFHQRAEAIMLRHKKNKFSKEDYNKNITTHIIPKKDGLKVYGRINSGLKHTTRDKLTNTDLAFANLINSILEEAGITGTFANHKNFPNKFRPQLSNCIYAYKHNKSLSYRKVFSARKDVRDLLDLPKNTTKLKYTKKDIKNISEALSYVVKFYEELMKKYPQTKGGKIKLDGSTKDLFSCSTLFGFLMIDRLRTRNAITDKMSPKKLAGRVYCNNSTVLKNSKMLNIDPENCTMEIAKVIKPSKYK